MDNWTALFTGLTCRSWDRLCPT